MERSAGLWVVLVVLPGEEWKLRRERERERACGRQMAACLSITVDVVVEGIITEVKW